MQQLNSLKYASIVNDLWSRVSRLENTNKEVLQKLTLLKQKYADPVLQQYINHKESTASDRTISTKAVTYVKRANGMISRVNVIDNYEPIYYTVVERFCNGKDLDIIFSDDGALAVIDKDTWYDELNTFFISPNGDVTECCHSGWDIRIEGVRCELNSCYINVYRYEIWDYDSYDYEEYEEWYRFKAWDFCTEQDLDPWSSGNVYPIRIDDNEYSFRTNAHNVALALENRDATGSTLYHMNGGDAYSGRLRLSAADREIHNGFYLYPEAADFEILFDDEGGSIIFVFFDFGLMSPAGESPYNGTEYSCILNWASSDLKEVFKPEFGEYAGNGFSCTMKLWGRHGAPRKQTSPFNFSDGRNTCLIRTEDVKCDIDVRNTYYYIKQNKQVVSEHPTFYILNNKGELEELPYEEKLYDLCQNAWTGPFGKVYSRTTKGENKMYYTVDFKNWYPMKDSQGRHVDFDAIEEYRFKDNRYYLLGRNNVVGFYTDGQFAFKCPSEINAVNDLVDVVNSVNSTFGDMSVLLTGSKMYSPDRHPYSYDFDKVKNMCRRHAATGIPWSDESGENKSEKNWFVYGTEIPFCVGEHQYFNMIGANDRNFADRGNNATHNESGYDLNDRSLRYGCVWENARAKYKSVVRYDAGIYGYGNGDTNSTGYEWQNAFYVCEPNKPVNHVKDMSMSTLPLYSDEYASNFYNACGITWGDVNKPDYLAVRATVGVDDEVGNPYIMSKGILGYSQQTKYGYDSGYSLPSKDTFNVMVKNEDRESARMEYDGYISH